jgi:methionyl-tRNA formyltransferase
MRLVYAGTAPFGALVLAELLRRAEHELVLVVTRPDKPRGRHGTPQPSPVKEVALAAGLPFLQPEKLAGAAVGELLARRPDAFVVCAYGEIVRSEVLEAVATLVVHPSAVPRWRGAAPVERALMAGETDIGVAVLRMTQGVDEGPVGDLRHVVVPRTADAGQAFAALSGPAVDSLVATLRKVADGTVEWIAQTGTPTYAHKLEKHDRVLDWTRPAAALVDQIRALSPAIGARATVGGRPLILWRARALGEPPSDDQTDRLLLPTVDGWLEILELQAPGGRRQETAAFLRGAGRWLTGR